MMDEQAIVGFYTNVLHRKWTYIHQRFNAIPWKMKPWLQGHSPAILHYFGTKPWEMKRTDYPDLETWWVVVDRLVQHHPSIRPWMPLDQTASDMYKTDSVAGVGYDSVAEHYNRIKREDAKETRSSRDEDPIIGVRRANNFLKAGLISAAINIWRMYERITDARNSSAAVLAFQSEGLRILDLACGNGADAEKCRRIARDSRSAIRSYLGVDVSKDSVRVANEILHTMVRSARQRDGMTQCEASAIVANLETTVLSQLVVGDSKTFHGEYSMLHANQTHIASCQFALHYFFRHQTSLVTLANNLAWALADGGVFVGFHADGERIARYVRTLHAGNKLRWEEGGPNRRAVLDVGHATIKIPERTVEFLVSGAEDPHTPDGSIPPFGYAYDFTLGSRVQGATEYVVHTPTLDNFMLQHGGLVRAVDVNASELVDEMRTTRYWTDVFHKTGVSCDGSGVIKRPDRETVGLYRAFVYIRDSGVSDRMYRTREFLHKMLGLV